MSILVDLISRLTIDDVGELTNTFKTLNIKESYDQIIDTKTCTITDTITDTVTNTITDIITSDNIDEITEKINKMSIDIQIKLCDLINAIITKRRCYMNSFNIIPHYIY